MNSLWNFKNSLKLTTVAGLLASAESFNNCGKSINNNGNSLSFSRGKTQKQENKGLFAKNTGEEAFKRIVYCQNTPNNLDRLLCLQIRK